jgi:molybdopterin-containing oxidoreductase family iron-sulfur binding subunit
MSDGIKRRDFLKVLGVGGAGATVFGCSTEPAEKLIPYVVPEEEITPGVATWYTSVCSECPAGCGIWVRTREGRAVKVEGNPNHPISQGGICSRGHSSLQGLYDPDRLRGPLAREGGQLRPVSWDEAENLLSQRLQAAGGGNVMFLTGKTGPAFGDLVENFVSAVGGSHVEYELLSEAPLREAARIAFGRNVLPSYDLSDARCVISFGADFLETWLSPVEHTRGFAESSVVDEHGSKGRFVFVGPRLSLTGQNADEWVPIRPGHEAVVALAMAHVIADGNWAAAGPYGPVLEAYDPESVAAAAGISANDIEDLARRFRNEGPAVALGPGLSGHHRNATAANLAVLILNSVAGYVGGAVRVRDADFANPARPFSDMEEAIASMSEAEVVMVQGANPAYSLPPSAGFAEAFGAAGFKVSFTTMLDETSRMADLVLPDRHALEAWGDSNPRQGVYALQQPVMQPVPHFETKQAGDVLLSVATRLGSDLGSATFYDYLRARWARVRDIAAPRSDFEEFWREALRRGVVDLGTSSGPEVPPRLRSPDRALSFDTPAYDGGEGDPVLLVYPSSRLGDGGLANRPWLQELPDPVSKITWHSWLEMHPATAGRMDLVSGDIVRVRSGEGELEVPVWIYPGIREDTVAIAMGGGHDGLGRYADGNGVNPMTLLPAAVEEPSGALVLQATRVSLEPTGERRRLATIEGSSDQHDRSIAPAVALVTLRHTREAEETGHGEEATATREPAHGGLRELQETGGFVPVPTEGRPEDFPLEGSRHGEYDPDENPRWAMAIDLDRCTGCSACITACQAENNVPWVGEEQILMGRDMHWVRLERYQEHIDASHAGEVDVRHLPMICQHCGNAPCEPVCPVYAAYHTPEGLNAQIYNRCVGTRYCANNCPYKVRVFNWFQFSDVPEPLNWQYNPDVTVRGSGVMEKCTFCVQRIRDAQNRARIEGQRDVEDGEVVPACQQGCPAKAIVFGDARDVWSRVAEANDSSRAYRVLDDIINTQPAVTYLKKVTHHDVEGEH